MQERCQSAAIAAAHGMSTTRCLTSPSHVGHHPPAARAVYAMGIDGGLPILGFMLRLQQREAWSAALPCRGMERGSRKQNVVRSGSEETLTSPP